MRSAILFFVLGLAFIKYEGTASFLEDGEDSEDKLPQLREKLFARIRNAISKKIKEGLDNYNVTTQDNCTLACPAICAEWTSEPFKEYCEITCRDMCAKMILFRKYYLRTDTTENQILARSYSKSKIQQIDANQDGFISLDELKTKTQDPLYLEAFMLLDTDGDGMITYGEYKTLKDIVEVLKEALKNEAEASEEDASEELNGLTK